MSCESTTSGKMISTGSSYCRFVRGNHGTVGVSNRGDRSDVSNNSVSSESTTSSKVISTGSSNSGLVSRDHGTVRVSNQMGVQVERSGVSMVGDGSSVDSSNGSSVSSSDRSSVTVSSMGTMSGSQGSKMVSTGSSHGWLIHRDHSTIRMTHQAVEAGSSVIAGGGRSHNDTGRENQELHVM